MYASSPSKIARIPWKDFNLAQARKATAMTSRLKKSLIALALPIVAASSRIGFVNAAEPRDLRSDTWVATDALGRSLPVVRGGRSAAAEQVRRGLLLPVAGPVGRPGAFRHHQDPGAGIRPRSGIRGARSGGPSCLRITGASRSSAIMSRTMRASSASMPRCWPTPTLT